jgi:hypothetical protein
MPKDPPVCIIRNGTSGREFPRIALGKFPDGEQGYSILIIARRYSNYQPTKGNNGQLRAAARLVS